VLGKYLIKKYDRLYTFSLAKKLTTMSEEKEFFLGIPLALFSSKKKVLKSGDFCSVTPCNQIDVDRNFREKYRFHYKSRQVMLECVGACEMSTYLYKTNIGSI
jgi:hypothetical protein